MLSSYKLFSQRLTGNLYILSTREAFVALIPFLILTASLALITSITSAFDLFGENSNEMALIADINVRIYTLLPLLTLISLSYYLGKSFTDSPISCAFLSVCCFSATEAQVLISDYNREVAGQFGFYPSAIIIPFIVIKLLELLHKHREFNLVKSTAISAHLRQSINLIIPYFIIVASVSLALYFSKPVLNHIFGPVLGTITEQSAFIQGIFRVLISHLLWFLGIHGDNTYSLLVDSSFLGTEVAPNTRIGDLINFFSLMGGSGATLPLILAILLFSKDQHSRHIGKISIPFAVFNINEILIYGLPIVFNPYLIVPFIFIPLLNFVVSYVAVNVGLFHFVTYDLTWITPPIINTYLASDGNVTAILFQVALLVLGIFIYRPFIKMSHMYNSDQEEADALAQKLEVETQAIERRGFIDEAPQNRHHKSSHINLIEEILAGDLQLKFQPVIECRDNTLFAYNLQVTLPRYDGKVISSELLNNLQRQSLSTVIFTWKLNQLFNELDAWAIQEYRPRIIIHLDNSILSSFLLSERFLPELTKYSNQLILTISHENSVNGQKENQELTTLRTANIEIIIKDFDGDISNLAQQHGSCLHLNSDWLMELKRTTDFLFIEQTFNYLSLCSNYLIVENIDTDSQRELCQKLGIHFAAGDALAMPIIAEQVYNYQKNWQTFAR